MFEKDMQIAVLLDCYGDLLSDHRRSLIEMYYFDDLSLAEIAENTGISRQGVRESVKKSEAELRMLEEKLHLAQKFAMIRSRCAEEAAHIDCALALLPDGSEKRSLEKTASFLRNIPI